MNEKTPRRQILRVLALAGGLGSLSVTGSAEGSPGSSSDEPLRIDESSGSVVTVSDHDLRRIEYGETKRGSIDTRDPTGYVGYYEPVEFRGSEGDRITISMESETGDMVLGLLDPAGDVVASDDDGGFGYNSEISSFELDTSGTYTIIATSYNEGATFEYDLTLTKEGSSSESDDSSGFGSSDEDLRRISAGETKTGTIDQSDPHGYNGYYEPVEFRADEGDRVTVEMVSDRGDTYLMLLGPNGDRLVQDDDGYGSDYNSRISDYEVDDNGEFTIVATSYDPQAEFDYSLSLEIEEAEPHTEESSQSEQTEEPDDHHDTSETSSSRIEYGDTVVGELDSSDSRGYRGEYDAYTFRAERGDRIEVEMRSRGDTYLILLDPNGSVVARNDDGLSDYDSKIDDIQLNSSGEYRIIATSYSTRARFEYELSLRRLGSSESVDDDTTSTRSSSDQQEIPDAVADADLSEVLPLSVASYENESGPAGSSGELLAFSGGFGLREAQSDNYLSLPTGIPGLFNWDSSGQSLVGNVGGNINLWPQALSDGFNFTVLDEGGDFHPFFYDDQIVFYRDGLPHAITNTSEIVDAAENRYSIPPEVEELRYTPALTSSVGLNVYGPRGSLPDIRDREVHLLTVQAQVPGTRSTLLITLRAGYGDIGSRYQNLAGGSPKSHLNIEVGLRRPRRTFFNLHAGMDVNANGSVCLWAYEPALRQHYNVPTPQVRACDSAIDDWVRFVSQYLNNYRWQIQAYQQINAVRLAYSVVGALRNVLVYLALIGGSILMSPFAS